MQNLEVISVNIWNIVVALANLVLLFLIVKRFLYKPVMKMLSDRQASIQRDYDAAEEAREKAEADQEKYETILRSAKTEADGVIQNAVNLAAQRESEILAEAKDRADGIVRQAENEALLQRKKAEDAIRDEIVQVSSLMTEKVLEREIREEDHARFVDSFLDQIGEENGTN